MKRERVFLAIKLVLLLLLLWLCLRNPGLIPVLLLLYALWRCYRAFRAVKIAVWAVAILSAAWLGYQAFALPPPGPQGEVIPQDEDVWTSEIIANGVTIVNNNRTTDRYNHGRYNRDGHPKTQGCALANFTVKPPEFPYKAGVFQTPLTYKAWVRFSSGDPTIQSDWKPDARGVAIKLLGVEGDKLLPAGRRLRTQDFVMIDYPTFFVQGVVDYLELTRLQVKGYLENNSLLSFRYFFQDPSRSVWNPMAWRLRQMREAIGLLGWPPRDLLSLQYYSMSAYTLGASNYVKYSLRPAPCTAGQGTPWPWVGSFSSDVLRHGLEAGLKKSAACFDFLVQPQKPLKNMPVEDTTIEWKEKDSPFIPVARLEIPKQQIEPYIQSGFCENLSFTPWHALPEHRPVGGLNRVRQYVYQSISNYRHCKNGTVLAEPPDDGSPVLPGEPCDANQPISQPKATDQ